MAKPKTTYFCQSCGYETPKWLGKCPACQQWNTFVEEVIEKPNSSVPDWKNTNSGSTSCSVLIKLLAVNDIAVQDEHRYPHPIKN